MHHDKSTVNAYISEIKEKKSFVAVFVCFLHKNEHLLYRVVSWICRRAFQFEEPPIYAPSCHDSNSQTLAAVTFEPGLSPCSAAALMCWSYRHLHKSSSLSNMDTSRGYCCWTSLAKTGRSSKLPNISRSCKHQIKTTSFKRVKAFVCKRKGRQRPLLLGPLGCVPVRRHPQEPGRKWHLAVCPCRPQPAWTSPRCLHTPGGQKQNRGLSEVKGKTSRTWAC